MGSHADSCGQSHFSDLISSELLHNRLRLRLCLRVASSLGLGLCFCLRLRLHALGLRLGLGCSLRLRLCLGLCFGLCLRLCTAVEPLFSSLPCFKHVVCMLCCTDRILVAGQLLLLLGLLCSGGLCRSIALGWNWKLQGLLRRRGRGLHSRLVCWTLLAEDLQPRQSIMFSSGVSVAAAG